MKVRENIIYIYIAVIFLTFNACNSLFDFTSPVIKSITPAKHSVNVNLDINVTIEFSKKMNKFITEESIHIYKDSNEIKGFYQWDNKKVNYCFNEKLKNGFYKIVIDKNSEDINGNNLENNFESNFIVGDDLVPPEIKSFSLLREENSEITKILLVDGMIGVKPKDNIEVEFSEEIDLESCYAGLEISPQLRGNIRIDKNKVLFTPYDKFQNGVKYTMSLSAEIKDLSGNNLLKTEKRLFTCGVDFISPTMKLAETGFLAIQNSEEVKLEFENNNDNIIEKKSSFKIIFSESMDIIKTEKAISFSPSIEFFNRWENNDKEFILTPKNKLRLNQIYSIIVDETSCDKAGNFLDEKYTLTFKVNGINSKYIFIEHVGQLKFNESGIVCETIFIDTIYSPIRLYEEYFYHPVENENLEVYIIRIIFNNELGTLDHIDLFSAFNSVEFKFDQYIGNDPDYINKTPVIWKMKIPDSMNNAIDLHIYNLIPESYYKIKVKSGEENIADSNDNYLLEDYENIFRT